MKKVSNRKNLIVSLIIFSLLLVGTILAHHHEISFAGFVESFTQPTPTPQPTRPKHQTKTKVKTNQSGSQKSTTEEQIASPDSSLSPILAATDFNLIGLIGTVNPTNQTVPKNIPTAVLTSIQVPEGENPAAIISELNPNYRIRGELTGPSLTSPRIVEAAIGQPLPILPLPNVGDHVLQNLRIVDMTDVAGATIAPVAPDSVGITVIDNILVTEVRVTEMTYEQIIQSGINLNDGNYNFYNFILALATSSGTIPIQIPVALPTTGGLPPVVGNTTGGVGVNGVPIPLPDIVPIMLEGVDAEGNPAPIEMPGGGGMLQIPGVVVFPGRIGLLNQFFEAIVIVGNGAPNGTPLVITNLRARANLPDGGTPADLGDDPLRIAATQQGGVQTQLDIHGLGPDGRYGTADDTISFNPGQSGQATFLLEGRREGLHTIDFDLEGTLQGLPTGNVTIRGSVPGAVLVRDAEFGVTFTHPSVIRAGQEYDLGLTVFNSGARNLNGIALSLRGDSVSGATLIDSEVKTLNQTIPPGGSGTVKWRLRSNTTGQVTASYVKVGEGIDAGLNLVTGVGDRNVPLSPDSLILPEPVRQLSPDVVEAARQMLGQAWSVATAPAGSLPSGVLPILKQTVVSKAVELGWAGLRIQFHEDRDTALRTLARDWLGENDSNSSTGFADALRNTPAGYYFFDVVGTKFFETVGVAESPFDFHRKLVAAESSRSSFISAFVSQPGGQQILGAKINSPTNQSVGFGANATERFGDLRTGASLNLLETDPHDTTNTTKGNFLLVSKPTTSGNWSLEINGWADGNADISILAPTSGKNYRQLIFSNVGMTAGKRYRISFRANGTTPPIVEEFTGGAFRPVTLAFTSSDVLDPNPEITGVIQVTEDVIEGGDKYGRLVGVLFSKPMTKTSVESISRYQIGGGQLVSDPTRTVGKLIRTTSALQNFGERFAIMALDSPVGPFIKRTITANGMVDKSGKIISNSTKEIEMRVSPQGNPPGAYLTGRVLQADGTPVPNAGVFYRRMKASPIDPTAPCGLLANWETVAFQRADSNGEFAVDYVREGECHPVTVLFQNTATNSEKTIVSNVAYNGQHLIFNAVYLARGNVQGTVTSGGVPLANANVSILSELDPLNNKLVRTNAQGFYSATGVPVGGMTVKAVGTGVYSLSSGIAAGNLSEPGATVTVNVTTQNISGIIKGKVLDSGNGQSPIPNSLVIAKANIPGFPSINGPIPVGFAFTGQDGSFTINRLPIGNVYLEATDPQRGISTSATVQLTPQNTNVEGVILLVSNGFGRVFGRVLNEIGQVIPNAIVQEGSQAVQADIGGNYVLPRTREGNVSIRATDPLTRQTGSTTISVRRAEDTTGADIVIRRPANLNGQVFITQNGTTTPLAQAFVSTDGRRIVRTDSQGRYTLSDVESGTNLIIRFVHPQGRLFVNTNVFLNPGETLSRNATFRPGRIHGKITQPDGVTPVITGVGFTTSKPHLGQDVFFGLPEEVNLSYQTTTDGLYAFESLNPINYRVSASNVFFPIPVSQSGVLPPNTDLEINLSLVDSLAGKIHGHIYQPDGTTPVGAGVRVSLGGGNLADVTVRTDAAGYYEFAEVFAEGGYTLTALDPLTNRTNRTGVSVRRNQDIEVDLRLLGRGNLKVKVIDGGGLPLQTGSIRVEGSTYPNDQRYIELTAVNNSEFDFTNLTEGTYAVSALYLSLGGRVSATVTIGGTTEVTVQVQAVGNITGRVFMPNGTTTVGLADVTLRQNGRIIGLITTQDSEEERGKFDFSYVPAGDFTIDVFDNRSGRRGRSAGTITGQGNTANVTVNLLAIGTVVGQVTANGVSAEQALVNLSADGSGISGTSRVATTDSDGRFRFPGIPVGRVYVSVTNGPGGLTGQSQGIVAGTNEPLPETIINVALTPTATVTGVVYKFGGTETFSGALVKVSSNNFSVNTTTDENGRYRVNFIPLGTVNVKVESPFGYDRGTSAAIVSNQAGATVTADVTMTGVGNINGTATGSNGNPLTFGRVTFTNTTWGENITVVATVGSNGTYSMTGLPTGDFNLKLTVAEIIGVGTAIDNLTGGQTLVKNLQLESAGKVFGNVKATDGTSPAVGADVTLSLARQGGGFYTFITHTDEGGDWEINNLPLGTISVGFSDANTGGMARLSGLNLNTNGQELDTGTIVLDITPIAVESVLPVNNAVGVRRNSAVQIFFSEAVDAATVHSGSVRLKTGNSPIGSSLTISSDGKIVTLTPNPALADTTIYTVEVTTAVQDGNGIALANPFSSSFTTADETAPSVAAVAPVDQASRVSLNENVVVTFNEGLGDNPLFADIIKVAPLNAPANIVSGNFNLSADRKTVTFTPSAFAPNVRYQLKVTGQKDIFGNTQTVVFTSIFTTVDNSPPILYDFTIDSQIAVEGLTLDNLRPFFSMYFSDDIGIDTAETKLYLARQGETLEAVLASVSQTSLSYRPLQPLAAGQYVTKVTVTDTSGNQSSTAEIVFTINPQFPEIYSVTPNYGVTSGNDIVTIRGRNLISRFSTPGESERGLIGEYYQRENSQYFPFIKLLRTDGEINFDLLMETFTPYIASPGNEWVTWRGKILPRYSEEYTLAFELSGGVKIFIDGQLIVNGTAATSVRQESGTISLEAGREHDITIEHFPFYFYPWSSSGSYGERHVAKLFWSSSSQPSEIVPREQLRPAARAAAPTVLFGGQPATVIGAISADEDQIAVITPPHIEELVAVQVQKENETVSRPNAFNYYEDSQPPYAQVFSPSNVSNIAPPNRISVTFNEPLAADQNFNDILKVFNQTNDYEVVAGTVTIDETNRKLIFVPSSQLAESTRYQILVSNQRDTVGNINTSQRDDYFSTTDRIAPEIYSVTPPDQSTVFDRNTAIRAFYGDNLTSINQNSAVMILDGVDVTAQSQRYSSSIQYQPPAPLAFGTHSFVVRVADIAGNIAEKTTSFTVAPDTEPPVIDNFTIDYREVVEGFQTRLRQPFIAIYFQDNGPISGQEQKLFFGVQGSQLPLVPVYIYNSYPGWVMYYAPEQDLAFGFYSARVELTDAAGNMTTRTVSFEVVDIETIPPSVVAISPAYEANQVSGNTAVQVTFSEPLDRNQNFANSMSVNDSQTYQRVEGTYALDAEGRVLTFTPNQPLSNDTRYYVNLSGYLDLVGNPGNGFSSSFTTVDTIAPVLEPKLVVGGEEIELNNARIFSKTPDIFIRYYDNLSGVNEPSFSFTLDGVIQPTQAEYYGSRYTPPFALSIGIHTITAEVADTRGNLRQVVGSFEIIADPGIPFTVEDDTMLLWHLDEIDCYETCITADAGPFSIGMDYYSYANPVAGRFEGGAGNPNFTTSAGDDVLSFGANSFTVEGWLNYEFDVNDPPSSPYQIWSRGTNSQKEYVLSLLPNGDLQARVFNAGGVIWETVLSRTTFDVADGQWHSLAMVVERGTEEAQNQLKIYVDGEMRMSGQSPLNFGAVRTTNGYFRLGSNSFSSETKVDEIRISNSARSSEQINKNFDRQVMGLVVLRSIPAVASQGTETEITLEGYNLEDISASVTATDGTPIGAAATVLNTTATSANIRIAVESYVPLGNILLTITSGSLTKNVPLRVVNQQPFTAEVGSLLLWHIDELSGNTVADAGPFGVNGFSTDSIIDGRFGKGRNGEITTNTNPSSLSFGGNSFTIESWIKGNRDPNNSDRSIFSKGQVQSNSEAFVLDLNGGVVRARLRDTSQVIWEVKTNPQQVRITDGKWHYIAMVVRRGATASENRLLIFIDGIERANIQSPAAFGSLRNTTQRFKAGYYNLLTDEVRILNFARTPAQIAETWLGAGESFGLAAPKNMRPVFGKKNPPESPPVPPNSKSISSRVAPTKTRIEVQKEERK